MDDVRLYERALSAAETSRLLKGGPDADVVTKTLPSQGQLYAAARAWRRLRWAGTRRCATLFGPSGEILTPPAAPRKRP